MQVFNCKLCLTGLLCKDLAHPKVMVAGKPLLLPGQRNMWKELFFYISQLVISSAGQPLTSLRDPDTHKGSIPTVVKEVGKPFNAVKGREEFVSKETGRKREEKSLKCFQQVRLSIILFNLLKV